VSRPAPGLGSVGETLHRILAADLPDGISAGSGGTADAARVLLRRLRRDVTRMISDDGPTLNAEALGVSRSTLDRWRGDGGWLAAE
jgi:hypothetical protein